MTSDPFVHQSYLVRKKILKIFGAAFHIYDPMDQLVLFCSLKAFKLKEDIRVYESEARQQEILLIQARNVIDFGATYDVLDARTNERLGALRRKGLKSMLKDEWLILDTHDQPVGAIIEDSTFKALVRRFVDMASLLLPQAYHVTMHGQPVAVMRQNFNPFVGKITVDFSMDATGQLDRRLGLAATILMCAIEGKQG